MQRRFVAHPLPHTTLFSPQRKPIFAGVGAALGRGDLDNNGLQDLYVVNGMYSESSFGHLPGAELIEHHQVFRNEGGGRFRRAPEWRLGRTAGGRARSMADLDGDGDGDLDIVVNNLGAPAELLENRLCGGASLQVDLRWPGSGNTRAIGSRLTLHASTGSYVREIRSSSGFLSGDPAASTSASPPAPRCTAWR